MESRPPISPREVLQVVRQRSGFSTWLGRLWRPVLLAVGLVAIVLLVRSVGPDAVLRTLLQAGPWVPLVFALEFLWIIVEGIGLLILYGSSFRAIPPRSLASAFLVHMSTMLVLPVGRAGAEVARATMLTRHVGAARAAAASTLMQSLTLLANTVASVGCALVVWEVTGTYELPLLLVGNGAATLVLGCAMFLVLRHVRLGGFLGRHFRRIAELGPEVDRCVDETRGRQLWAFSFCVLGRLVQTLQYGVMLAAVTSAFSFPRMFVAQGIHLVGAGLGDMVPNQVGVTEGAFRLFAATLGLGEEPEKAVSVALLARLSVLCVAGLGALLVQLLPREGAFERATTPADVSSGS